MNYRSLNQKLGSRQVGIKFGSRDIAWNSYTSYRILEMLGSSFLSWSFS